MKGGEHGEHPAALQVTLGKTGYAAPLLLALWEMCTLRVCPQPGKHIPCWGIFLQPLPLLLGCSSWPAFSWHVLSPLLTLPLSHEQATFSTWEAVRSDPAGLRRLQLCSEGSQRLSPLEFQKYFNGETTALWLKPKFCIVLSHFFFPLPFCRMVEYSLDLQNINLSAIRTVRVLRPLKAINRVPSKSWFPLMPTLLGSWGVHGQ